MKKKCVICGEPCERKYCSEKCSIVARKQRYRAKHPKEEKFYVFYDKDDFVKFWGTRDELIEQGEFTNRKHFSETVSKIKRNVLKGNVVILPLIDKNEVAV